MTSTETNRRAFLTVCSGLGLGTTLLPGMLFAQAGGQPSNVTPELVEAACKLAGLDLDADIRGRLVNELSRQQRSLEQLRQVELGTSGGNNASSAAFEPLTNANTPACLFNPILPGMVFEHSARPLRLSPPRSLSTPKDIEDVAFYSVRDLGELIRTKRISATNLTQMYLARLKRYDPMLHFVINYTEDRALAQAKEVDKDIAAGKYRGPLHGIPWGAKDLLAVKGYPTTWGAEPYMNQMLGEDATVVKRLDGKGAILLAKLSLGALAQNDVWFAAMTRNPWLPSQGSSGSSAGPASATAAGCVAFSIGSETQGSISSPSTRCGATGLRPTYGRVPRTGAMTLSWSQDKLGPLCRHVEDCALVLDAIQGPESAAEAVNGGDRAVANIPFSWDAIASLRGLRVGYVKTAFDRESAPVGAGRGAGAAGAAAAGAAAAAPGGGGGRNGGGRGPNPTQIARRAEQAKADEAVLDVLRGLGVQLVEVALPPSPAFAGYGPAVNCEGAAAFDSLTRSGRDKLMEGPDNKFPSTWPNTFRIAHFYPAVDFINADRMRFQLMQKMEAVFKDYDVIVLPTGGSGELSITNLTGHPSLIQPNGFYSDDGTPHSITFLGRLYGEEKLCQLGRAYQEKTGFNLKHPDLDAELKKTVAATSTGTL